MDGNSDDQYRAGHGVGGETDRVCDMVTHPSSLPTASFDPLAAAINALPDGFGVLERVTPAPGVADFVWSRANPALLRLIGADRLIGLFVQRDHADGRADTGTDGGAGPALFRLLTAAAAAPHRPHETIIATVAGRCRTAAQGYGDVGDDGCAGFVSLTVSVTDADRRADPLRVALEHSRDAVALFDAEGRLMDATRRLKELFPETATAMAAWTARRPTPDSGGTVTTFRTPDGLWLRNSEWRTPDGGAVSIFTDVTAFKEQEERLSASEATALAAKREAESASRAKSDFLTHMSHELRTPLNAVIGFAELMEMETLGPLGNHRYVAYVRDILDSGRRLLELVDDALNLSRIDAGRVKLVEEMIDISQEIAVVAQKADAKARKQEIVLTVEARGLPLLVADRRAVHQMIEHLLSNALKFTPPQGRVMVSAALTPDGGVGLMVADTGSGIAEEDLPKVVLPFGRTEMSVPHQIDGTGLGLPVVKRLIELHGGRLELDSAPGVGTTAILIFPAERIVRPMLAPFPLRMIGA
jgi:two-component system, cell cycle sensor histidine kinase PleC